MTTAQRHSAHRSRLPQALALTAALGVSLSLAACSAPASSESSGAGSTAGSTVAATAPAAGPSTTALVPANTPAPTSAPPAPERTPAPAPTQTSPESTPAAAVPLCTAASLTGSLAGDGGAGAGQLYQSLVVTNTSNADCILDGYPGVSLVMSGTTDPLGEPAVRDAQAPSNGPITLKPGRASAATLHYSQASNYQDCQRVEAQAFLVYPPSATDSLEVPVSLTACSNPGINLLTIGAFQP